MKIIYVADTDELDFEVLEGIHKHTKENPSAKIASVELSEHDMTVAVLYIGDKKVKKKDVEEYLEL